MPLSLRLRIRSSFHSLSIKLFTLFDNKRCNSTQCNYSYNCTRTYTDSHVYKIGYLTKQPRVKYENLYTANYVKATAPWLQKSSNAFKRCL